MKQPVVLNCEFVRVMPNELAERTLYVSMYYATVTHKCCCGCGNEVVTPLSPTDWKLTYDGETISISPSIGNWSFKCRSHYWIDSSAVRWDSQWSNEQIEAGRISDRIAKEKRHAGAGPAAQRIQRMPVENTAKGFWSWLSRLWSR